MQPVHNCVQARRPCHRSLLLQNHWNKRVPAVDPNKPPECHYCHRALPPGTASRACSYTASCTELVRSIQRVTRPRCVSHLFRYTLGKLVLRVRPNPTLKRSSGAWILVPEVSHQPHRRELLHRVPLLPPAFTPCHA